MTWKTKLILIIAAIILLASLLFIIKQQHDALEKQKVIETSLIEMKQFADGIARSDSRYTTKEDMEKYAKQLDIKLDPIRKDLEKFDANIKAIQSIKVISTGYTGTGISSTTTEPKKPTDPTVTEDKFNYLKAAQVLKLQEPFNNNQNVPFGEVKFKAWQEKPWDLTVHKREYTVTNVLGQDDNGKHYAYSKFGVTVEGKNYPLTVTEAKMVEELPSAKFRFNPTLLIGIDAGAYLSQPQFELNPNAQIALFSYSQTKQLPTWLFLGLGMGYSSQLQETSFLLSPVNYNIADHIPLIQNLYLGPALSLDTKGNLAIYLGLRVAL